MKEFHEIEMDFKDRIEVDLNVNHLRFVPSILASIRKANIENQRSVAVNNYIDTEF